MKSIEWASQTYNPVVGECPHHCVYCYVKKMRRFPQIAEKYSGECRLIDLPVPSAAILFVASCNDVATLQSRDIQYLVDRVADADVGKAVYLTKDPEKLVEIRFPDNAWVGTSVESAAWSGSEVAPAPLDRIRALGRVSARRWLSLEPAVTPFGVFDVVSAASTYGVSLVVVGGFSGGKTGVSGRSVIKSTEVSSLVTQCERSGIPLYRKPNLKTKAVTEVHPGVWS